MRATLRRLLAVAVLAAVPAAAPAAPVPPSPNKGDGSMAAARKALDEVGDMNYQAKTLTDLITDIKDKTKVPVVLDNQVYNFGLDPNQPIINVNLKQVKLKDGLKAALAPFNLKFGLTQEGLFISTEEGVITRQMRQRVSLDCDGTEFAVAARQLATDTGANLVVDPRLKDKAKVPVTLKLDDVPLETAVRLLADVADLRTVRMSNVLYVTSHERAKVLRDDADGPTSPSPFNPVFPNPGGIGIIGGGIGAFPVVAPPPAACPPPGNPPVVEEKKVEEKKGEEKKAEPEKKGEAPPPPEKKGG
jgi:hypothetical protein